MHTQQDSITPKMTEFKRLTEQVQRKHLGYFGPPD